MMLIHEIYKLLLQDWPLLISLSIYGFVCNQFGVTASKSCLIRHQLESLSLMKTGLYFGGEGARPS